MGHLRDSADLEAMKVTVSGTGVDLGLGKLREATLVVVDDKFEGHAGG